MEGDVVRVAWTRAEMTAMREAVELTPFFDGRPVVRDAIRDALRPGLAPPASLTLGRDVAERFAGRLVTGDLQTALAKVKLLRALRDTGEDAASQAEPGSRAA